MDNIKPPKAVVTAPITIGGAELMCAVLDDKAETRIIKMASVFKAFDRVMRSNARLINIPAFMDAKSLQPYINQQLKQLIRPIEYLDGNKVTSGYNALILAELCDMYLAARRGGALTQKQLPLAEKAEILQSAFAKVGMIALIDEATGHQFSRKYDALRILIQQYISDGIKRWTKRFPDKFFEELDRLYDNPKTTSHNRPMCYGKFINKYVYDPIENGYLKEKLDELNITSDKKRKARFHQWLSEFGVNQLQIQIGRVMGVSEISPNLRKFKSNIARQQGLSVIQQELFDSEDGAA